jgi:hypothetical protein
MSKQGGLPRNWRVYFASPVPFRWIVGAQPRQLVIQLLTDFGDPVSHAGDEGPWDSDGPKQWDSPGDVVSPADLLQVKIVLSIANGEDPRAVAPIEAQALLRVWEDRGGTRPLDPANLVVSSDSTCKVWVSLDASGLRCVRGIDGIWLRLKGATALATGCPLHGLHSCADVCVHHPGLGEVLPIFSTAFRVITNDAGSHLSSEAVPIPLSYLARIVTFPIPAASPLPDDSKRASDAMQIIVYEDSKARGTGGNIWDVSLIMSHLILSKYARQDSCRSDHRSADGASRHSFPQSMRGIDAVELGAGTGLKPRLNPTLSALNPKTVHSQRAQAW